MCGVKITWSHEDNAIEWLSFIIPKNSFVAYKPKQLLFLAQTKPDICYSNRNIFLRLIIFTYLFIYCIVTAYLTTLPHFLAAYQDPLSHLKTSLKVLSHQFGRICKKGYNFTCFKQRNTFWMQGIMKMDTKSYEARAMIFQIQDLVSLVIWSVDIISIFPTSSRQTI